MESLNDLTKKKNGGNHFAAFLGVNFFQLKGPTGIKYRISEVKIAYFAIVVFFWLSFQVKVPEGLIVYVIWFYKVEK